MAQPGSALPFLLRRKTDVVGMIEIITTTEVSHGMLRIEEDTLVVQWSTARETVMHLTGEKAGQRGGDCAPLWSRLHVP